MDLSLQCRARVSRQDRFGYRSWHGVRAAAVVEIPASHFHTDRRGRFDGCARECSQLLRHRCLVYKPETRDHRTSIIVSVEAGVLRFDSGSDCIRNMAIVTVVAPGFLTVQPLPSTNTTDLQVPQPYFNMINFGTRQSSGNQFLVSGDAKIYKLAYLTSISGQPMPLKSIYPNQTYHLDFEGPAVKCMSANDSLVYNITIDHGTVLSASSGNSIELLSWVAGDEPVDVVREKGASTLDVTSPDAARLFVMTSTGNWNETLSADSNGMPYQYRKVNVTECQLYNATYSVDFVFNYPDQSRNLRTVNWLNPVATITELTRPNPDTESAVVSYTAMMEAFGKMIVGTSSKSHYGAHKGYLTISSLLNIDWSSSETIARDLEQTFQNFTLNLLSDSTLMYVTLTSHAGVP